MNKKAQSTVGVIFVMLAFWLVHIYFLSPFIHAVTDFSIANGEITGLFAFVLNNLTLLIGFASVAVLFWMLRGSS